MKSGNKKNVNAKNSVKSKPNQKGSKKGNNKEVKVSSPVCYIGTEKFREGFEDLDSGEK